MKALENDGTVLLVNGLRGPTEAIKNLLVLSGHTVLIAPNKEEGFHVAQSQHPDLIVSEISTAYADGIELCRLIRASSELSKIPILLIGDMGKDSESVMECLRAGANDYLETPYHSIRLITNVVRLIERKRAAEESAQQIQQIKSVPRRLTETVESIPDVGWDAGRAPDTMREDADRYRLLFESNPQPMWVYDMESLEFLAVNEAAIRHYGYRRDEFLAMTIKDIRPPEDIPALMQNLAKSLPGPADKAKWRHRKKNGEVSDVEVTSHRLVFADRPAKLVLANDITERVKAKAALKKAEEKYKSIFENVVEGIFQTTADGRVISANPAAARMLGYESPEELMSSITDVTQQLYAAPDHRAELVHLLEQGEIVRGVETQLLCKDGSRIWVSANARTVHDATGTLVCYEGSFRDITDHKQLEEQLRQSQKIEAVGRLAGGIAHDFNNLLTVITGYSSLTLARLPAESALRRNVEEIKSAGDRAASLTGQLLAFSRKQVLQPVVLDINALITDHSKMLQRLVGENIELITLLTLDAGRINADPTQIEQVLMNLVVNARDAMPRGGKIVIETANVELDESYTLQHIAVKPGRYVMIAVSDTGMGMDEKTQARMFEPFFTTKEAGRGTGLGLSTVYGIVKQSGGNIWVYSELGRGTTFKVYVPWTGKQAQVYERSSSAFEHLRGTETILVVEDEEVVRNLVRETLEIYGYKVLESTGGRSASSICKNYDEPIHLVVTDVIMPEMNGRELANELAGHRPETRVLFMSGYTDDAIVHHGVLDADAHFIQKPFSTDDLARKVRDVLDSTEGDKKV